MSTATSNDREEMLERYAAFAESLARRFSRSREDLEDVRQVALLGLVHAIDRYDPDRGVAFTTFAWSTISGELRRYRRDHSWGMRVPRRLQERYLDVARALDDLSLELGHSPSLDEIAQRAQCTPEEVVEALEARHARTQESLDGGPDDDRGSWLSTSQATEVAMVEDRATLAPLLALLDPRDREIVRLRFWEELTQAEIGARLGLSQMHVSRLLRRALTVLREAASNEADQLTSSSG